VNCEALINRFLLDYHAGALSMPRRLQFEFHLTLCRDCRRYVDSYRKTVTLTKAAAASEEPVPPELVQAILKITNDNPSKL
jgi:anti-sigma factor RsiW